MRSKLECDKNARGKRQNEVRKRDVTADSSSDESSVDYMPPWFDRYVEYKFSLLDRTGQTCYYKIVGRRLSLV